eukprot:7361949-Prymnesium_polylepis.1
MAKLLKSAEAADKEDIRAMLKAGEHVSSNLSSGQVSNASLMVGRFTFVFEKAASIIASPTSFVLKDASEAKSVSAKRVVTTCEIDFFSRLNLWIQVCHATGLVNALVSSSFVHKLVYEGMRLKNYSWMLVYELFLIYLTEVDESEDVTIATICKADGGVDDKLSQAKIKGSEDFKDFTVFRTRRGEPRDVTKDKEIEKGGRSTEKKWNGKGTAGASPCYAWNFGTAHKAKHLMEDGTCRFAHECSQFVRGKGPKGMCGATDHGKHACRNPDKCLEAEAQ